MKQRERTSREDMGVEAPVGDTRITPNRHKGPTLDPLKPAGFAQAGDAQTVGAGTHESTHGDTSHKLTK